MTSQKDQVSGDHETFATFDAARGSVAPSETPAGKAADAATGAAANDKANPPTKDPESPAAGTGPAPSLVAEEDTLVDTAEGDAAKKAAEAEAEEHKRRGGWQRKIDRLERALQEKDRLLADKDRLLAESQKKPGPEAKPPESSATETPAAPDPNEPQKEQFSNQADYLRAIAIYTVRKENAEAEAKARADAVAKEAAQVFQKHNERMATFRAATPDYDEIVGEIADVRISPALEYGILRSEIGPQVIYALATQPQELARLSALPPMDAGIELGKFEARLSQGTRTAVETEPPPVGAVPAPAPITPIRGKATIAGPVDLSKVTDPQEFFRRREEQIKAKKQR